MTDAIGARHINRLQRRLMRLAVHLPAQAKHPVAVRLKACARAIRQARRMVDRAVDRVQFPWDDLFHLFLQTSLAADVKVPCPHCKEPATLSEIEELKTYCFGCSNYGMPPLDDTMQEGTR